tara:strand:- start:1864 stop:2139 length:276 start_codon:yes stop_codon:yes gene_type:complete
LKTILVNISEFDEKVLSHALLSNEEWLQNAIDGKINNVKKRLVKEAQEKLFNDDSIENIPATVEGLLNLYFEQDYYKNRVQREEEELNSGE